MTIKLHRCPATFVRLSGHPCWKVQKALDEAGIAYEIVKQPVRRSRRTGVEQGTGQHLLPVIEFEDGTMLHEESADLAARIREGRLPGVQGVREAVQR